MSFKELAVWQRAHILVLQTYRVTEGFPDRERYGLVSQVRRSAASIPANMAGGFGRKTTKELLQYLANAIGSLEEMRYFLILSRAVGYWKDQDFHKMDTHGLLVAQIIAALGRSLPSRLRGVRSSRAASHGSR